MDSKLAVWHWQTFTFVKSDHPQRTRAPDIWAFALQIHLELWRRFLVPSNREDQTLLTQSRLNSSIFCYRISCTHDVRAYCMCVQQSHHEATQIKKKKKDHPGSHSHLQTITSCQSAYCACLWTGGGIWDYVERTQADRKRFQAHESNPQPSTCQKLS